MVEEFEEMKCATLENHYAISRLWLYGNSFIAKLNFDFKHQFHIRIHLRVCVMK